MRVTIFYKMPPSFNHINEWARHVSSDSSEAVLQVIAMMGHSLIGEYVAKGQVLNVLYRYLVFRELHHAQVLCVVG